MQIWEFKKRLKEVLDTVPPEQWIYNGVRGGRPGCLMQRALGRIDIQYADRLIRAVEGLDVRTGIEIIFASDHRDRGLALAAWNKLPDGPPEQPQPTPLPIPVQEEVLVAVR